MTQIKSVIDSKVVTSSRRPYFSGAMKASPLRPFPADHASKGPGKNVDYVLPSRRMADSLMSVYWRQVHPLYPFLDPEIFPRTYESVWTGLSPTLDERILMCTLNTVFALAPQHQVRHESNTSPNFANQGEHMGDFDFRGIEVDLSDMSRLNIVPGNLY